MSQQTVSFGGNSGTGFSGYPPVSCSSGKLIPNNSTTPGNAAGERWVRIHTITTYARTGYSLPSGLKVWVGSTSTNASNGSGLPNNYDSWWPCGAGLYYGATGYSGTFYFGRSGTGSMGDANGTTWTGDLWADVVIMTFPTAPTIGTTSNVGQGTATVNWSAPGDLGGGSVIGYAIDYSTDGSSWSSLISNTGSTSTSYVASGLAGGATYYFRVGAITNLTSSANTAGATSTPIGAYSSASAGVYVPPVIPAPVWYYSFGSGKQNNSYSSSVQANYASSVSLISGSLPPGLSGSFDSGTYYYTVWGTPTTAGTYNFTLRATNTSGSTDQAYSITINPLTPPTWSDISLSGNFVVGVPYSTSSGGNNSVSATNSPTYSIISGSLPAGISLGASTGVLSGTPTTRQSYSFVIRASNSDGTASPDQTFSGSVIHPPTWTDETLGAILQGRSYSDAVSVSTSTVITWTVTGTVPTGLTYASSGTNSATLTFSGTPTGSGAYSFTVRATNVDGFIEKTFSGNVVLVPNWTDNVLSGFVYNVPYTNAVTATNSPTYAVSAGTLPTGISLNSTTGAVTGTPTDAVGTNYSFTITATNSEGSVSQAFSGQILPDLGGKFKVYNGSSWIDGEIYVYDGSTWVLGKAYVYDGSNWIKTEY